MNSVHIILEQFRRGNLSEEEAVNLIEDLYSNKSNFIPVFTQWPQITYTEPKYQR